MPLWQSSTIIQSPQPLPDCDSASSDAEDFETCASDLKIQNLDKTEEDTGDEVDEQNPFVPSIKSTDPSIDVMPLLGCKRNCPCLCHQPWIMRVAIAKCLGFARIKLRGLPLLSGCCTDSSCDGRSSNVAVEVNLRFPQWLLSKAVALSVLSSRWHEPCFNLRVRNVIPIWHPWFRAFLFDNVDEVQRQLRECPSRVNDVDEAGYNALAVSERFECGFLLECSKAWSIRLHVST